MSAGEKYLAAAYVSVFFGLLVYVVIMALKLARLERELGELAERERQRRRGELRRREHATGDPERREAQVG